MELGDKITVGLVFLGLFLVGLGLIGKIILLILNLVGVVNG